MSDLTKKSPFRILIEQASALGIERIRFDVNTKNYTEDDELRWEAWVPYVVDAPIHHGTNGQHALTELVAARRFEVEQKERNRR